MGWDNTTFCTYIRIVLGIHFEGVTHFEFKYRDVDTPLALSYQTRDNNAVVSEINFLS